MAEQWKKWEPIQGLSEKYYVESIVNIIGVFKVFLCDAQDQNKKIVVIFENSIDVYRSTQENLRLSVLHTLKEQYGEHFYETWTFFKITDSTYVQWLSDQSYKISDAMEFQHFVLIGTNTIVDLINYHDPKVEFLNNDVS